MKKILLIAVILLLTSISSASAHPGRTASDGCHYCRTNCDSWGVPWNERHCHGGYTAPVVVPKTYTPTNTPVPPTATPYPTSTPIPTNTPIPTSTPTSVNNSQNISQDVAGASTSSDDSSFSTILGLLLFSVLIGGIYFKNKKDKSKPSPNNL